MEAKIKMPEAHAIELSENEAEMKLFDSLSYEKKKEYIENELSLKDRYTKAYKSL